jgi:DNA-binding response OmpR family regulator
VDLRLGPLLAADEGIVVATQVLLVEPDEELLSTYKRYLERRGYSIYTASSGAECVEHLQSHTPGVLIIEPELPDGWGPRILSLCRTGTGQPHPPVVCLSRRSPAYISTPVQAYHVKPTAMSALVESIQSVLCQEKT